MPRICKEDVIISIIIIISISQFNAWIASFLYQLLNRTGSGCK